MSGNQGWHPDPGGTGGFRYWDGERWGDVRSAPGAPPAPPTGSTTGAGPWRAAPALDLGAVAKRAGWAQVALTVAIPIQGLGAVAGGVALRSSVEAFRVAYRAIEANPDAPLPKVTATPDPTAAAVSQLSSLAMVLVAIVFLVWFHGAATQARALGLPARRTPGWGVAGFLIPVVNLWFPYRSVKDLFPPGDRRTGLVGRWFFTYLGSTVALLAAQLVLAISTPVGLVAVLLAVALLSAAVLAARQLVEAVSTAHAEVAATR